KSYLWRRSRSASMVTRVASRSSFQAAAPVPRDGRPDQVPQAGYRAAGTRDSRASAVTPLQPTKKGRSSPPFLVSRVNPFGFFLPPTSQLRSSAGRIASLNAQQIPPPRAAGKSAVDLTLYGRVLRRFWWLVVPGVLLAFALAFLSFVRVSANGIT